MTINFRVHRALGTSYFALFALLCIAPPTQVHAQDVATLKNELLILKMEMQRLQEKINTLTEDKKKSPPVSRGEEPANENLTEAVTERVLSRIQPAIKSSNKSFPSEFNPAIGFNLDVVLASEDHNNDSFQFRAAEMAASANIDPFTKGAVIINGNDEGVEVEEAYVETTALPHNLTLRGGRFFADFGRLSKFHDHALPFVNRPIVVDSFMGGESQGDGLELSYLLPTSHYVNLTVGAYNKVGGENERVQNSEPRGFSEFTYLGRASTYFDLHESHSLELGTSVAYTPRVKIDEGSNRVLGGLDMVYRYTPLESSGYQGMVWGSEIFQNREHRPLGGFPEEGEELTEPLTFSERDTYGLYSYVELRNSKRWYSGFLFDFAQDIDRAEGETKAYSPYVTLWLSEFQRLRLQYTNLDRPYETDHQFFLQWTAVIGSHTHGFRDR